MLCAADGALRVDLRGIGAGIGDADRHRGADQNGGINLKHKIIIVINAQALQNIADAVAAAAMAVKNEAVRFNEIDGTAVKAWRTFFVLCNFWGARY